MKKKLATSTFVLAAVAAIAFSIPAVTYPALSDDAPVAGDPAGEGSKDSTGAPETPSDDSSK